MEEIIMIESWDMKEAELKFKMKENMYVDWIITDSEILQNLINRITGCTYITESMIGKDNTIITMNMDPVLVSEKLNSGNLSFKNLKLHITDLTPDMKKLQIHIKTKEVGMSEYAFIRKIFNEIIQILHTEQKRFKKAE